MDGTWAMAESVTRCARPILASCRAAADADSLNSSGLGACFRCDGPGGHLAVATLKGRTTGGGGISTGCDDGETGTQLAGSKETIGGVINLINRRSQSRCVSAGRLRVRSITRTNGARTETTTPLLKRASSRRSTAGSSRRNEHLGLGPRNRQNPAHDTVRRDKSAARDTCVVRRSHRHGVYSVEKEWPMRDISEFPSLLRGPGLGRAIARFTIEPGEKLPKDSPFLLGHAPGLDKVAEHGGERPAA